MGLVVSPAQPGAAGLGAAFCGTPIVTGHVSCLYPADVPWMYPMAVPPTRSEVFCGGSGYEEVPLAHCRGTLVRGPLGVKVMSIITGVLRRILRGISLSILWA